MEPRPSRGHGEGPTRGGRACNEWSGRQDSNLRPRAPKARDLPTDLRPGGKSPPPGSNRGLWRMKPALYLLSYEPVAPCRRSLSVFCQWQGLQSVCAFSRTHVPPLEIGMMWSTSRLSRAPHTTQAKPSRTKARGRIRRSQALSRVWFRALLRAHACSGGACSTQRPDRTVRRGQPPTRHIDAALGITSHPSVVD